MASITTRINKAYQNLSRGDQAELRRGTPGAAPFWRVLHQAGIDLDTLVPRQAERWRVLLTALAHARRYDPNVPLGRALAEAGWSEVRFVRLMEAEPDTLGVLLRRCAQYLNNKQQAANWNDARKLLFYAGEDAERERLRIARDYYRARFDAEQASTDEAQEATETAS
jgi:CRISPR system Cascade subunit CasB